MNKYEIIGIVGEGAYGIVYKAKCKETGEFGKYSTHSACGGVISVVQTGAGRASVRKDFMAPCVKGR